MSDHHRVVWSEGMLLSPQHLQQWDRYAHHAMAQRFRALQTHDWGFSAVEVDREALRNGRLTLNVARGVLPDGTPFSAPDEDALPPARSLEGLMGPRQETLPVFLGLPSTRTGRAQFGPPHEPGVPTPRYSPETLTLIDDNDISSDREITVARRNLALLFPEEPLGDHDLLPLAEVVRLPEGGFTLRDSFVPPCISIGASETLMRLLQMELEWLVTKSSELGEMRRHRRGAADFAATDAVSFWLLRTANAYIPVLAHFVAQKRAHPEEVYRLIASLAGEMCTFSSEVHPKDLPRYDHGALGASFSGLDTVLRGIKPESQDKVLRIELIKEEGSIYVGRIPDPRLFEPGSALYIGVQSSMDENQLVLDLPPRMVVGSRDKIDYMIAMAIPGVPLTYVRVPPPSLPIKSSFVYFQLDGAGAAWDGVKGAKNVAIFAPPDIPGLNLELLGLRG